MNGMPLVRLELDQMRTAIMHQFTNYNKEISEAVDKELKKVIENFDYESTIIKIANETITKAIEDYFTWRGEGKKLIEDSVTQALDKIFKANAQSK